MKTICDNKSQTQITSLPFWYHFDDWAARTAFVSTNGPVSYIEFDKQCRSFSNMLTAEKSLILIDTENSVDSLAAIYGCFQSNHTVLLCELGNQNLKHQLINTYSPDYLYEKKEGQWILVKQKVQNKHVLHQDLALLLSTSGSTGDPKMCSPLLRESVQQHAIYLPIPWHK